MNTNHRNRYLFLVAVGLVAVVALIGCTGGQAPVEDDTDGDYDVTTPEVDATPFTYPDYTDTELEAVPTDIGTAYDTFSDDPSNPHFPHREKPLSSEYTQDQLEQLKRAFQVAWYYYHDEFGIDLGDPAPADALTGVQADGLVHKWNQNWLVQNLVDGDNTLGDPWELGLSALLLTRLSLPDPNDPDSWEAPQVFVITDEVLMDYDRGPNETGTPVENLGNTQSDRQIFENGLYDVVAEGERAIWKLWESEAN